MHRPLENIKVLDLSTMLAASSCSRIFAEWGATVIKVEAPGGDMFRNTTKTMGGPIFKDGNPIYDLDNANKQFVALNLKSQKGYDVLMKMLEDTDILITNYREKALQKLNIDYDSLKTRFPRLIYAWTGGYGPKGPEKDKGGFDYTTFYARCGILQDLTEKGHPPLNTLSGLGDHTAGLCLALAAMAALYARSVTGLGDRVETSLYHAGLYVTSNGPIMAAGGKEWPRSRYDANQITSTTYQCKDGTWLFLSGIDYDRSWPILCKNVFEHPELLTDERFSTRDQMLNHIREGIEIIEQIFIQENYSYWAPRLKSNDIPFEKCVHFSEVLNDEQALANDYFTPYTYPGGETINIVRAPAAFASCPELIPLQHAKKTGADTCRILSDLGYSAKDIESMNANGEIKA